MYNIIQLQGIIKNKLESSQSPHTSAKCLSDCNIDFTYAFQTIIAFSTVT